jgi:uncharacterized protein YndB with AHSA1/START domain
MSPTTRSQFVYVTFIRTTPEKLWEALTDPKFIRQYWFGSTIDSAWKKGAPWTLKKSDGQTDTVGEVLEIEPLRRVVLRWQNERVAELAADGPSRCTIELEPKGNAVKLTITHEIERPDSKLIHAVSGGWPLVVSNLKSLLETGTVAVTER